MSKRLEAEHGVVCRLPGERLGYFGWPTVARADDGTLIVASSGLRREHVCPWGKTVLNESADDGRTWSPPRVINDSTIDDRDAGVVDLGAGRLLVSWFTSDTRQYLNANWPSAEERASWRPVLATWTDEMVAANLGSWVMLRDGRSQPWGKPIRVPVSAPHGPIHLRNGNLLYLGKQCVTPGEMREGNIVAATSGDSGKTWAQKGIVPVHPRTIASNYHEPHVVELPSGQLVGMIRVENAKDLKLLDVGVVSFSMMQTQSDDGGRTWSQAKPLGFHGSPPHLMRHSSGVLVLSYGYRQKPWGQRVALSHDEGMTWDHDWVLRDDGPDDDLGYPSTVELADGSLFTVCYQKAAANEQCSLLWSRWRLP